MNWKKGIVVGFMAFGTGATLATIGQERKPLEPKVAVVATAINAVLAYLVVTA